MFFFPIHLETSMDRNSAQCLMIITSKGHSFPQSNFIKGFPKEKDPSKPILSISQIKSIVETFQLNLIIIVIKYQILTTK